MKDKRNKFFQLLAVALISAGQNFCFKGSYLTSQNIELSLDTHDKTKAWIEKNGEWVVFTDIDKFKSWIKQNIK